jgi:AcrR family transcriptional regulator
MPKVSDEHLAARRRQILDAALVRFARHGFHGTSMQAICDEAHLSPGAVYRYFRSKEEIVQAIASETLGGFANAIEPGVGARGPDAVLERLLDALEAVELREERLRLAVQIWGEALHNPEVASFLRDMVDRLADRVAADLREAQQSGALDPALDADAAARVLLAIAQGSIVQRNWYDDFDVEGFRAAARALLSQPQPASRPQG